MTKFQLIVTGLCAIFLVGGVAAFATFRANQNAQAPEITLWGSLDTSDFQKILSDARITNKAQLNIRYVEKPAQNLEKDLVEALARGEGPDMILMPHDLIVRQSDKAYVIPYKSYTERLFKDSFIQGAELFLAPDGVLGLPFSVDPLVMYWNRDIFLAAGLPKAPKLWGEFFFFVPKLTKKDASGNITQSVIALGDFRNVKNAKEILVALTTQAGDPIIVRKADGSFDSVFGSRQNSMLVPAEEALRFFTEFSNPSKSSYSWNRSLTDALTAFVGGKLAVYFGFASELETIREKNPNLNFDVALLPQIKDAPVPKTYGALHAFVILKTSKNIPAAYTAAVTLTSSPFVSNWARTSGLPPVRTDLLLDTPTDAYKSILYSSALIAQAWFDPWPAYSLRVLSDMVDNVTSGKLRLSEGVRETSVLFDDTVGR